MLYSKLFAKPVKYLLIPVIFILASVLNNTLLVQDLQSATQIRLLDGLDTHPEYEMVVKPVGEDLKAGEESTLEFSIRYGEGYGRGKKAGDPVGNLQVVYDRILEIFIVSEDLMHLFHTRPEDFGEITLKVRKSSTFRIRHTFPWGGRYRLVANFSHRGQLIYKHFDIEVEGKPVDKLETADRKSEIANPKSGVFDDYNVTLKIDSYPPVAKQKTKLLYHITDKDGEDVNGIEVFMGTEMHMVCWRKDLQFFGYERTRLEEGAPGTVLLVPPVKTDMMYGTGILREILNNGKFLIEHGVIAGLLPSGKFPFKVTDQEAIDKAEIGDWVEFWVVNRPDTGLVITRLEPLAELPTGDKEGIYQHAGNMPIYPGPDVPVEHTFPEEGEYAVFSQFMYEEKIITTRFLVNIESSSLLLTASSQQSSAIGEDKNEGIVRLTPQEKMGQMIYRTSKSSSGNTIYIKQEDGSKFDAAMTGITCVGCHGEDGRGGQEAGSITSDIRYVYLTKPYGVSHPSGRSHPAYTDKLLKRAITNGIDPAGNKLDPTMIRWDMSDEDLNALVAYIHRLSEMGKPGVTDEAIKVGCVLDISGPLSVTGLAVKEMIEATFDVINKDRKIYGRLLKLVVGDGGNDPAKSLEAARRLVEEENVFCMIGNLGEAATRDVIPYLEEKGVPLIAPLAPTYQGEFAVSHNTFYMFPSSGFQAKVMIDYIVHTERKRDKSAKPTIVALYSKDQFGEAGLAAAKEQLANYRQNLTGEVGYEYGTMNVGSIALSLSEKKADYILVLTPDPRIAMVVSEADRLSYSPIYFCNNMLIMQTILQIPKASERFMMVQNFSFSGQQHPVCAEFMEVIKKVPSRQESIIMQTGAFAGVRILEEGLRLTGRDLTRRFFIQGLEKLRFDTGLFGPISYRPGSREGVSGVLLVRPDDQSGTFVPVTNRIRPSERGGMY